MRSASRALIALIALALGAAACGDDDAATTTATTTGDDTTAVTSAPPTTAVTPTSAATAETDPSSNVSDLLARFEVTPLRATYLLGMGDDQTEIILAQDPTADPPIESIVIVEDGSKIIISEDVTIFCDGSGGGCFEVPGGAGDSIVDGFLGPFGSGVFLTSGADGFVPASAIAEEPITVAGRDGVCFTYDAPAGLDSETSMLRQCIDREFGFTLLLQSEGTTTEGIETELELIDFAQPTAQDFEPTGPVVAAP
jgi:hypothetical protein